VRKDLIVEDKFSVLEVILFQIFGECDWRRVGDDVIRRCREVRRREEEEGGE
jgi:hypothetical protein